MIQYEKRVIRVAVCDSCQKDLVDSKEPHNVNFGTMKSSFGYGSRLDDIGEKTEFHLCENCWERAFAAVGLKRS